MVRMWGEGNNNNNNNNLADYCDSVTAKLCSTEKPIPNVQMSTASQMV